MTFTRATAGAGFVVVASWTALEIRHPAVATSFESLRPALASVTMDRLPSAIGALLALLALAELVARTVSSRAALLAVGVYMTMPLAFVPARLRSGGELVVGVITLAVAALVIAALDASAARTTRVMFALGGAALAVGAAALVVKAPSWSVPVTLGGSEPRTFDAMVPVLAYGLGPWVLVAPVALVSRMRTRGAAALSLGAIAALVALAFAPVRAVVPVTLVVPFVAGAIGVELASWRPSGASFAALVAGVGFLVVHDLGISPERLLAPLAALEAKSTTTAAPVAAAAAQGARIAQALLAATTAITAVVALGWIPARVLPLSPRTLMFVVPLLAGLGLRLFVYPTLLARTSPSRALETWGDRHREGELTAGLAGDPRTAVPGMNPVDLSSAAAAGTWLAAADDAGSRRWLTLANRPSALAEVNASYRAARQANLPLLVAGEETTLLATSELHPGETSENPFDRILLAAAPSSLHLVDARIEDAITLLGWQLTDDEGREISRVAASGHVGRGARNARLRVVLRALGAPPLGSCTFVHIDHAPARFAAEHRELAYPLRLWTAGEIFVDEYDVALGSDFSAGRYPMFWGMGVLPCEDDRRREVTRGPSDGHGRIALGELEVR